MIAEFAADESVPTEVAADLRWRIVQPDSDGHYESP